MAIGIPVIFGIGSLFWVPFLFRLDVFVNSRGEPDPVGGLCLCLIMIAASGLMAIVCLPAAAKRVEIFPDKVICKGLLPRETFEMKYDQCIVGMDYHMQNGGKIWWIYFCSGAYPKYKTKNPAKRINSIKIRPGFVRIMYSEELYQTLLEALPAKQCDILKSVHRYSGFEKQGKII